MEWQFQTFAAKPGQSSQEQQSPRGLLRIPPKPPIGRRVSYLATVTAANWNEVTQNLIHYWLKVTEVLPQYYPGNDCPDPLADEQPDTISADNGWDRIVSLLDAVNGKITTNLWNMSDQPRQVDRVWVIMKIPLIDDPARELSEQQHGTQGDDWAHHMHAALAEAATTDRAKAALAKLRNWREFSLWVMQEQLPETLQPLLKH